MLPSKLEELRKKYGFGRKHNLLFFPILLGSLTEYHPYYNFWTKNAPLYYPLILVSYGMLDREYYDVRVAYHMGDDIFLLTDSGAFQLFSSGKPVSQAEVLQWQLKWSDAGIILDHIPVEPGTGRSSPEIFKRSLELTKKNIDYIIRNFDRLLEEYSFNPEFKMVAVLHGASPDQTKRWEKKIIRPLFETGIAYCTGFSVAVARHPQKYKLILYRLGQLRDYGCIHTLGTSSSKIMALLTYISEKYNIVVQADSSSVLRVIKGGGVYWPSTIDFMRVKHTGNKGRKHHHWCPCPYCQHFYRKWSSYPWEIESIRAEPRMALIAHSFFYQFVEIQSVVSDIVDRADKVLEHYGYNLDEIEKALSSWEDYYSNAYEVFPPFFKEMASYIPRRTKKWW